MSSRQQALKKMLVILFYGQVERSQLQSTPMSPRQKRLIQYHMISRARTRMEMQVFLTLRQAFYFCKWSRLEKSRLPREGDLEVSGGRVCVLESGQGKEKVEVYKSMWCRLGKKKRTWGKARGLEVK